MNKETYDYVAKRVEVLANAGSSKQETKDAALAWQAAVKADDSEAAVEAATGKLLDFLEGRPTTIDEVLAFAQGRARELFGEDAATQLYEKHSRRKEEGARFCDCDACTAASELLMKFDRI